MTTLDPRIAGRLKRTEDGLLNVVVQQHGSGEVLMVAWMDDEALHRTLTTRRATYWSRSRREYWVKGETSGNTQYVHAARLDCDGDALLLVVDQRGVACHTGTRTCFDTDVLLAGDGGGASIDRALAREERSEPGIDHRHHRGSGTGAEEPAVQDSGPVR